MRLFLNGGGAGNKTFDALKKLNQIIDHNKPALYIPLAMEFERYPSCFEWISDELKDVQVPKIDMITSSYELSSKNLDDYSFIFIGGGNTFKLLKELKENNNFDKIKDYMDKDGIIFGGSAGAIVFGDYIDTCKYADRNDVNLKDLTGFNAINNICLLCHYTNQNVEKTKITTDYLEKLSCEEKIIALSEEVTLFLDNGKMEVIGDKPFYMFEAGNRITFNENNNRLKEFLGLSNAFELMKFMDKNITYGWLDKKNEMHINNMMNFRENYKTLSLEEIFKSGLGTCIDQAKVIKSFFDKVGLENKIYCHRSYENEENFDKDVIMHCFVLFKDNDKWYHLLKTKGLDHIIILMMH